MWAKESGEFEKENLEVKIKVAPSSSAIQLVSSGQIDATWSAMSAFVFNAVHDNFDLRWVLGAQFPGPKSKLGLWVRTEQVANLADMKGATIASLVGSGSLISYIIDNTLKKVGLSINDVQFEKFDTGSKVTALRQGAVDSAFLQGTAWLEVAGNPAYQFLGDWHGEPLSGAIFGHRLLREQPKVGLAFVRAIVRTYNTYFRDAYESDPEFVAKLAEALGTPAEAIRKTPELIWDPEIRSRSAKGLQRLYKEAGVIQYDDLIPASSIVDRSFYAATVGAPPAYAD